MEQVRREEWATIRAIPPILMAQFDVFRPRDGEELLFDQTYLHSAVNRTDIVRVILFCDVEKTQLRGPVKRLADAVNNALVAKFTGANDQGKLSWVSWAYKPIYKVRSFVKEKIKPRSLLAYNLIKYGSIALLVFLLYLALRSVQI